MKTKPIFIFTLFELWICTGHKWITVLEIQTANYDGALFLLKWEAEMKSIQLQLFFFFEKYWWKH